VPRLSVIIVAYNSGGALAVTLPALQRELRDGDEVIVVDNASVDEGPELAREYATVIESGANLGFPAGCNAGARAASGELLVFLNPDAVPRPGWGEAIRRPFDGPWAAWQALVMAGEAVNSSGNVVHFTGITWAGAAPVETPREVPTASGACLAVRAAEFRAIGGFAEGFFLYHEDTDLSLRLRLAGGRIGIEPGAVVEHEYEFDKGAYKWRLLERNRYAVLVRCWPARLLAVTLPALLATEAAIWLVAVRNGWGREKARASGEALRLLPRWRRERRAIRRNVSDAEFARWLTPDLTSPLLGPIVGNRLVTALLRAYWAAAQRIASTQSTDRSHSSS
jgi:GT2 family glycosyltransferase